MKKCIDCEKVVKYGPRCQSCATRHRIKHAKKKPCENCGKLSVQSPCHSCVQTANWKGNEERRKATSEQMKRNWERTEYRDAVIGGIKAKWNAERKDYYRELRKEFWTDDRKVLKSEQSREMWSDPEYRKRIMEIFHSEEYLEKKTEGQAKAERSPQKSTSIERAIAAALTTRKIPFTTQYVIPGTSKLYDFSIPTTNILIEVDGDYWHSLSFNIANDKVKNELAKSHGYTLVRIEERNITKMGALRCIDIQVLPLLGTKPIVAITQLVLF